MFVCVYLTVFLLVVAYDVLATEHTSLITGRRLRR